MRRTALIAAAIGGLFASASFGAFTFSIGTPNTTLIPGKQVVQLFVLNDGTGGTGTKVQAFNPTFTAAGGKFYINHDNSGTPGDASDDLIDFPNGSGPTGTTGTNPAITGAGNGFSYVRVAAAAGNNFVASATPNLADAYDGGITSFGLAETATAGFAVATSTVNGGLGFRTAVLVLDASATAFTLTGSVGGEIGTAQPITRTFTLGTTVDTITITPSTVTVDVSPPGLEGFSGVSVVHVGTSALAVGTVPAQIADNIVISGSGDTRTITGTGFTYSDVGTYTINFTAGGTTTPFTLNVVPEPTTIAALGMAGLGLIRRRK